MKSNPHANLEPIAEHYLFIGADDGCFTVKIEAILALCIKKESDTLEIKLASEPIKLKFNSEDDALEMMWAIEEHMDSYFEMQKREKRLEQSSR